MSLLFSESSIEIYRSIIENNTDAIFVLSVDGTFMEANEVITNLYGYSKEEIEGRHYRNLIVPAYLDITNQHFVQALQGTQCEYETQVFHKNGEKIHILAKNIPLKVNGEIIGIFGVAIDKTELSKTKASLNEMKGRVKLLFESNGDAIDILDLDGNVIDVNPAFEKLYGWKRDEMIGKPIPVVPKHRYHQHIELMQQIKSGEPVKRFEAVCIKKDGTEIYTSVTLSPILDDRGLVVGLSGITRDISKQKQLEQSLKESEERYKKVVEFLPKGLVIHREGRILYINPAALTIINEENAVGKLITDYIHPKYHEVSKERLEQTTEEQQELPNKEFELIRTDGSIIDIEVNSTKINFDGELAVLTLFKDITYRKQMERDLKESQKNIADLNMALDESSILAITNAKGIIEFANDKFCEISKYSREELIGQDHRIINSGYHPNEFFNDMWKTIGNGNIWRGEIKNKAKDGTFYWIQGTIVPFLDNKGKPYQYVAIRNDITEKKNGEKALRQSEERYRKLVEMSPEPIVVHTDGIMKYINPAGVKVFGLNSNKELLGKPVLSFVQPDYREKVIERMQNMKEVGRQVELIEEKIIRPDGSIIDVEIVGIGVIYDGKPSAQLIIRDITARKKVEEALCQSEEKYRFIAENMTDLVEIVDIDGIVKYASPSHRFVLGFTPEVYEGKVVFDFAHPEDLPYIKNKFEEMIQTSESNSVEYRHKHANGDWIWIEAKGTPISYEDEKINHIHIVSREISERKMYEEKLSYMAYHDILTGVPNRRLFQERLKQSLLEAERYNRKIAILFLDLDKFKQINDSLGHDIGDELLIQFVQRVKGSPTACPTVSFIFLKRSKSRNITANFPCLTVASSIAEFSRP